MVSYHAYQHCMKTREAHEAKTKKESRSNMSRFLLEASVSTHSIYFKRRSRTTLLYDAIEIRDLLNKHDLITAKLRLYKPFFILIQIGSSILAGIWHRNNVGPISTWIFWQSLKERGMLRKRDYQGRSSFHFFDRWMTDLATHRQKKVQAMPWEKMQMLEFCLFTWSWMGPINCAPNPQE